MSEIFVAIGQDPKLKLLDSQISSVKTPAYSFVMVRYAKQTLTIRSTSHLQTLL